MSQTENIRFIIDTFSHPIRIFCNWFQLIEHHTKRSSHKSRVSSVNEKHKTFSYRMANEFQPKELSAELRAQYEEAFILFDKDCDGLLNTSDLPYLMRSLGQSMSDSEMKTMFQQSGLDQRGKCTALDFVNMMERQAMMSGNVMFESEQDIRDAFRSLFDPKGTGLVAAEDIINLLQVFPISGFSQQQVWELLAAADRENTGKINYEDFIKALTSR